MRTLATVAGTCIFVILIIVPGAHAQNVRTIFLVRHADKVSNETDALLSDAGRRRAECLAKTLEDAVANPVKGQTLPVASDAARMLAAADRPRELAPVWRNAHPAGAQYPVRCGPAPKRDVVAGSDQLGCSRPKRSMILRARSPVLSPNATVQTCCRASG